MKDYMSTFVNKLCLGLIFCVLTLGVEAQVTLVQWTFPTASPVADGGLVVNLSKQLSTYYADTMGYYPGNATLAAGARGWHQGMGQKAWILDFSSYGYQNLKMSCKLKSDSTSPGPRDFVIEYHVDCGTPWKSVPGSSILVGYDWNSGSLNQLPLPTGCENAIVVYMQIRMTSNYATNGLFVDSLGLSLIDDIVITGDVITGLEDKADDDPILTYPNPTNDFVHFSDTRIRKLNIVGTDGSFARDYLLDSGFMIDLRDLPAGIYFVRLMDADNQYLGCSKLIKQ